MIPREPFSRTEPQRRTRARGVHRMPGGMTVRLEDLQTQPDREATARRERLQKKKRRDELMTLVTVIIGVAIVLGGMMLAIVAGITFMGTSISHHIGW